MSSQLFSTFNRPLMLVRLGVGQIKSSIINVPICRHSVPLFSKSALCRHPYAFLSTNSQLRHSSYRTVGQLVLLRGYKHDTRRQRSAASYVTALFIFMIGAAYAGVPLYRMICQVSHIFWLHFDTRLMFQQWSALPYFQTSEKLHCWGYIWVGPMHSPTVKFT